MGVIIVVSNKCSPGSIVSEIPNREFIGPYRAICGISDQIIELGYL
jgi:hypothetical protein